MFALIRVAPGSPAHMWVNRPQVGGAYHMGWWEGGRGGYGPRPQNRPYNVDESAADLGSDLGPGASGSEGWWCFWHGVTGHDLDVDGRRR